MSVRHKVFVYDNTNVWNLVIFQQTMQTGFRELPLSSGSIVSSIPRRYSLLMVSGQPQTHTSKKALLHENETGSLNI